MTRPGGVHAARVGVEFAIVDALELAALLEATSVGVRAWEEPGELALRLDLAAERAEQITKRLQAVGGVLVEEERRREELDAAIKRGGRAGFARFMDAVWPVQAGGEEGSR